MCGIIGLIAPGRQVSFDLYNGLLNLQHRGQDNAGIFTTDENQVYLVKGRGLVAEVFNWKKVEGLKGSMGIGQVRYPTTAGKLDSQPFYLDQGGIALAHNGNIYNEKSLRQRLENSRIYCDSDCDAETILKVFAYYFNRKTGPIAQRCFAAAKKTMQKLDGSYSVVAVIRNAGFFAFRDPHAIRPFVWGKKTWNGRVKAYAFASESVAIESLVDSVSNVRPGEAIFISKNLDCQRKILNRKKRAHCFFEWVYFSRSTSIIENISVNRVRWNLGKVLAEIYSQSPLYERLSRGKRQVIVAPVPETARPASLAFAQRLKYQYKDILEKNRFIGRVFLKPNEAIRRQEIAGNMRIIEGVVKDKIVLLIDDSIVRGTTSRGIVQRIRSRGAKEVHLLSTCPPLIYPCFYGVDFPDPAELVAYKRKITEIEAYIGADSITYMTLAGLTKAIGLKENQLCTACLTGRYPTSLDQLVESL
ncbi:MAG TPA: amidophosphoribosyltransferase [Candidatus Woesebacteria bacterium]|nr:amidophosphoribosyltransferase [Candidatus Woesebacteria bacterium]